MNPFETETMAELCLRQGHRDEALALTGTERRSVVTPDGVRATSSNSTVAPVVAVGRLHSTIAPSSVTRLRIPGAASGGPPGPSFAVRGGPFCSAGAVSSSPMRLSRRVRVIGSFVRDSSRV